MRLTPLGQFLLNDKSASLVAFDAFKEQFVVIPIQGNHPTSPEFLTAFGTLGLFANQKDKNFTRLLGRSLLQIRPHRKKYVGSRRKIACQFES